MDCTRNMLTEGGHYSLVNNVPLSQHNDRYPVLLNLMMVLYYCTVLQHRPTSGFILDMAYTGQVPVMALTATATPAVQQHIMEFWGRPLSSVSAFSNERVPMSFYSDLMPSKQIFGQTVSYNRATSGFKIKS